MGGRDNAKVRTQTTHHLYAQSPRTEKNSFVCWCVFCVTAAAKALISIKLFENSVQSSDVEYKCLSYVSLHGFIQLNWNISFLIKQQPS